MDKVFQLERKEEFTTKLEEIFNNLYNSRNDSSIYAAEEDIKDLLLQTKFQPNKIEELLLSKGYEEDKIQFFLKLLDGRKNKLLYLALSNHNSSFGEVVVSYDWALKLICGTSELQTIKYPIIQLGINSYKNTTPNQKVYDIDKDTLLKLIKVLDSLDLSSYL